MRLKEPQWLMKRLCSVLLTMSRKVLISQFVAAVAMFLAVTAITFVSFASAEADSAELLERAEDGYAGRAPVKPFGAFGLHGGIGLGYGVYTNGKQYGAHVGAGAALGNYGGHRFGGHRGYSPFYG